MLEQDTVKWLRAYLVEPLTKGPSSKEVKFLDVHQELEKELQQ